MNPLSETGPRQLPDLARPGPPEQPPEVARALARHRRPPPPSDEAQLLGPDGRPLRPKKESLPPPSKSPTASGGSTPTNASKEDPLAQKVAGVERDFSKAVDAWLAQNSDTTPDARERFADHLTQQYMCSVLDALPSTDAVRSVRRRVAAKIELVAAGVREPAPSPPKKRTAPWHCPACGRTNEPAYQLRRLPAERARRPGRGSKTRRVDRRDEGAVRREGERDPGVDGGHGSVPQKAAG